MTGIQRVTGCDGGGGEGRARAPSPFVVVSAGDHAEWRSTISSTSSCPRETEGGREEEGVYRPPTGEVSAKSNDKIQ